LRNGGRSSRKPASSPKDELIPVEHFISPFRECPSTGANQKRDPITPARTFSSVKYRHLVRKIGTSVKPALMFGGAACGAPTAAK
jgi:hypothetical protein